MLYNSLTSRYEIEELKRSYPFLENREHWKKRDGQTDSLYRDRYGEHTGFLRHASFHANENITTGILLRFAREYARAYAQARFVRGFGKGAVCFVSALSGADGNPDGVDLVNGLLKAAATMSRHERSQRHIRKFRFRMAGRQILTVSI